MLRGIQEEITHPGHSTYGMFVLVIMTHGSATHLYGADGRGIEISRIYDTMSAYSFGKMAGKPKLIILQACSGG